MAIVSDDLPVKGSWFLMFGSATEKEYLLSFRKEKLFGNGWSKMFGLSLQHVPRRKSQKKSVTWRERERAHYIDLLFQGYQGLVFYVEWLTAQERLQDMRTQMEGGLRTGLSYLALYLWVAQSSPKQCCGSSRIFSSVGEKSIQHTFSKM